MGEGRGRPLGSRQAPERSSGHLEPPILCLSFTLYSREFRGQEKNGAADSQTSMLSPPRLRVVSLGPSVGAEPPGSVCVGAGRGSWASKEGGAPAAQLRAQEPGLALPQCISVCLPICLNPSPPHPAVGKAPLLPGTPAPPHPRITPAPPAAFPQCSACPVVPRH